MEPLQKRSDGIYETPSGRFAVVPRYSTGRLGRDGETTFFRFKPTVFSDAIEVRWPTSEPFVIIAQEPATAMLRLGHAENITDELAERYALEVEKFAAANKGKEKPSPDAKKEDKGDASNPPASGATDFPPPPGAATLAPAAASGDNPPPPPGFEPAGKKGK